MRARLAAAKRKATAARFAEGWVCALSNRPPDTLFLGASVSHEVKCCAVGHPAHVGADFRHHFEGGVQRDAIDLRQIDAAGEMVEHGPDVEGRVVGPWLARDPWWGQRLGRRGDRRGHRVDVRFDRAVARLHLHLTRVEERQILFEREEMLGPVVACERCDDLGLGRATAAMPMRGQLHRVAFSRNNGPNDAEPRQARDVAEDRGQLQIHLHQRLLHALDVHRRQFDERVAMPDVGPQRGEGLCRPKAAAQEADAVQVPQPLSVRYVALPPRHVPHVPRIDQVDGDAAGLEDLVHRNPKHPRRFQRHTRYATRHEPVRQAVQIGRERPERLDRRGIPNMIGRHRDHVGGGATINPRRIGIRQSNASGDDRGRRGRRDWSDMPDPPL